MIRAALAGGDRVIVEQEARWLDPETGRLVDRVVLATSFVCQGGLITRIARLSDLAVALAASNLSFADEQSDLAPDAPANAS